MFARKPLRTRRPGTRVAEKRFAAMIEPAQPNPNQPDAEQLARLLELELIQKRVGWKQAGERYRAFRAAGFAFLAILILACLVGGYFAFIRMSEQRTAQPNATTSAPGR